MRRPCSDCEEYFEKSGKGCKLCDKCWKNHSSRNGIGKVPTKYQRCICGHARYIHGKEDECIKISSLDIINKQIVNVVYCPCNKFKKALA